MTVLHSSMLLQAGFIHGFGTRKTAPDEYPEDVHILLQVHGERIVVLTENPESRIQDPGEKYLNPTEKTSDILLLGLPASPFRFDEGDAMITDISGVSIGIRTADCLPLLMADTVSGAVCAVHCGWRSLSAGLAAKAADAFLKLTGSHPANLRAATGPSIGACHYEIGQEVRTAYFDARGEDPGLFDERDGRLYMDLAAAAKAQLVSKGMNTGDIEVIDGCTLCHRDTFLSYRAGDEEERMVSFITAREPSP
jgi:YfiH family protein